MANAFISEARKAFHKAILKRLLRVDKDIPSNADKDNKASVAIAQGILSRLGQAPSGARLSGQKSGTEFELVCTDFIKTTFNRFTYLRPGTWHIDHITGRQELVIAKYEQYTHLTSLDSAAKSNPELAAALGNGYAIAPDIVVSREPEADETINAHAFMVDLDTARHTSLRKVNSLSHVLHASISCKWTMRSDRSQNSRSEALSLIRNRKGHLPHIAVVTGEPLPSRLASIALGTGDIDCVYHFALSELQETLATLDYPDAQDMLDILVDGKRLKDIADLPLDLLI